MMGIINYVEEKLSILNGLYDTFRIVNPISKLVIGEKGQKIKEEKVFCFHRWERTKECENCISRQAYEEQRTIIKLRYLEGKVYIIICIPIEYEEEGYVIELLKDISNEKIIYNKEKAGEAAIGEFINEVMDLTTKDGLTGLYNRRYISEKLNQDLNSNNTSILMVDIDFFKEINDTYGHIIGDKVLKEFSKILTSCISGKDHWVGRYGGEEFLMVLNNADTEKAKEVAERIRNKVNDTIFSYEDIKIKITCSIGINSTISKSVDNLDIILKEVDEKLYKAKREGRNKIVFD